MKINGLQDEDFINYKKPSMFIGIGITCDFKCCTEGDFGKEICQNSSLINEKPIDISIEQVYNRYINNSITKAIVIGGLEPTLSDKTICEFVKYFREHNCHDDIVIYTGYYPYEISELLMELSKYDNIIFKFGRFKLNDKPRFDNVLGVELASSNQYGAILNQNVQDIIQAMRDNRGCCPCMLKQNMDTKCCCLNFRNQENGDCHCGIFRK